MLWYVCFWSGLLLLCLVLLWCTHIWGLWICRHGVAIMVVLSLLKTAVVASVLFCLHVLLWQYSCIYCLVVAVPGNTLQIWQGVHAHVVCTERVGVYVNTVCSSAGMGPSSVHASPSLPNWGSVRGALWQLRYYWGVRAMVKSRTHNVCLAVVFSPGACFAGHRPTFAHWCFRGVCTPYVWYV